MEKKTYNPEEIKAKATQFLAKAFGFSEKAIHKIVDSGSDLTDNVSQSVQKAYTEFKEHIIHIIDRLKEKQVDELEDGDLVISPVDIKDSNQTIIPAGEVFEFNENLIPYLKTPILKAPLYEPDIKTAVKWARTQENKRTIMIIEQQTNQADTVSASSIKHSLESRNEELNKKPEPEPASAL